MRARWFILLVTLAGCGVWELLAQRPFQEFPGNEYNTFPLPADYNQPAEFIRGRLRYRDVGFGFGRRRAGAWTTDYPRTDRHLLQGVRRLTRIDARSVEQVVDLDGTDDIYNWPFVYAVEVGYWTLNQPEASQLRDFLNRGGFFMVDDFHGTYEWEAFVESLQKVIPDRQIVDIEDSDPIFHTIYDLEHRVQVPGLAALYRGVTYERDGVEPRWRGVYDDKGRLVIAICHNMDLGDAWEHSDDPEYPEQMASLAYRIGMNYIIYDLTH
jgi:hypothetical protein